MAVIDVTACSGIATATADGEGNLDNMGTGLSAATNGAALQRILNHCSFTHDVIYIPRGTYNVLGPIYIGHDDIDNEYWNDAADDPCCMTIKGDMRPDKGGQLSGDYRGTLLVFSHSADHGIIVTDDVEVVPDPVAYRVLTNLDIRDIGFRQGCANKYVLFLENLARSNFYNVTVMQTDEDGNGVYFKGSDPEDEDENGSWGNYCERLSVISFGNEGMNTGKGIHVSNPAGKSGVCHTFNMCDAINYDINWLFGGLTVDEETEDDAGGILMLNSWSSDPVSYGAFIGFGVRAFTWEGGHFEGEPLAHVKVCNGARAVRINGANFAALNVTNACIEVGDTEDDVEAKVFGLTISGNNFKKLPASIPAVRVRRPEHVNGLNIFGNAFSASSSTSRVAIDAGSTVVEPFGGPVFIGANSFESIATPIANADYVELALSSRTTYVGSGLQQRTAANQTISSNAVTYDGTGNYIRITATSNHEALNTITNGVTVSEGTVIWIMAETSNNVDVTHNAGNILLNGGSAASPYPLGVNDVLALVWEDSKWHAKVDDADN